MTVLMEEAVDRLRRLPEDRQNELARVVMMLAEMDAAGDELTAEDMRIIEQSRPEIGRGEYATDEQVRAIWASHAL